MNKNFNPLKYLILPLFFLVILGCSTYPEKLYYVAPTIIPHTNRFMKTAGFWISRHPFPDRTILTPDDIDEFNRTVREDLKLTKDISQYPSQRSGKELKNTLKKVAPVRLHLN